MHFNVVIADSPWTKRDLEILFGDEPCRFVTARDLPNLLVELGTYKSTGEARRAGRKGAIPIGFTDRFKASKKDTLWIWNPTE